MTCGRRNRIRTEGEGEEEDERGEPGEYLGRSLLKSRTILISEPVMPGLTRRVLAQLLLMDEEDGEKPIMNGAYRSRTRLITLAATPAPNPLSMFTTVTPAAQELSMPSSAASPPKLAS